MHIATLLACQPTGSQVLDSNHGIDRIEDDATCLYAPWYRKGDQPSYYYLNNHKTDRAMYPTWEEAFNHIARSRRMYAHVLKRGGTR